MRPPLIPNSWKTVDFFFLYSFPRLFSFTFFFFFVYLKLFRYRKCRLHTCAMFFVCLRSPDSFLACFDRNSRRSLPSPSPTLVVFINKLSARIADETKSREECLLFARRLEGSNERAKRIFLLLFHDDCCRRYISSSRSCFGAEAVETLVLDVVDDLGSGHADFLYRIFFCFFIYTQLALNTSNVYICSVICHKDFRILLLHAVHGF